MTTTTYQLHSEFRCQSPCSHNSTMVSCDKNNEKDLIICQLKSHVFELEQHEKDYCSLEQRYNQLQNDIALVNQTKLRLENEIKNKDDAYNKTICNLNGDNENLQICYNEKLTENKKIFENNDALEKQIEFKECEICNLKQKINDLCNQIRENDIQRENLQKMVQNLTNIKNEQSCNISKLIEDNKTLTQVCRKNDNDILINQNDKQNLLNQLNEKNCNIQNLNMKLNEFIQNENCLQNNLNSTNNLNLDLQANIKDLEKQLNLCKNENDNLKNNLFNERSIRNDVAKECEQLNNILNNRNIQINQLSQERENMQNLLKMTNSQNCENQNINNKLKQHIEILTVQNQSLINEMENVIKEDEKMKCIMNRRDRILTTLKNNCNVVEKVKAGLCELTTSSNTTCRSLMRSKSGIEFNSPSHRQCSLVD